MRFESHDCVSPIRPHADCTDGDVKAQSSQTAEKKELFGL